jgi:putative acetyltransferase
LTDRVFCSGPTTDGVGVNSLDTPAQADDDPSVQLDIRPENREDQGAIRRVVRAAFDKHQRVADLVDLIRASPEFVPGLSLIACHSGDVVGHVMLSHAELVDGLGVRRQILELSPLAVAPALQRRGIGSALVRAGLAAAEAMGEPLVVLQGSHGYYPRFGFRDCRTLGIEIDLPDWAPPDAGMAYPLSTYDPSLCGHVIEPPAFAAVD